MADSPPANANPEDQYNNSTSADLRKVLHDVRFDFNDLMPVSMRTFSLDFDQNLLKNDIIKRNKYGLELVLMWWAAALKKIRHYHSSYEEKPIICWTGVISNEALAWLRKLKLVPQESLYTFHIDMLTITHFENCIFIEGLPHPSYAIRSGGNPNARKDNTAGFSLCAAMFKNAHKNADDLKRAISMEKKEWLSRNIKNFDLLQIPHQNGWLSAELKHLRHLPWHMCLPHLSNLKATMKFDDFIKLCTFNVHLHAINLIFERSVLYYYKMFESKLFWKFISAALIKRLGCEKICNLLDSFRRSFGNDSIFCKCINSIAPRLGNEGFMEQLDLLRSSFKNDEKFSRLMNGSIANNLNIKGYVEELLVWIDKIGITKVTNFLSVHGIGNYLFQLRDFMDYYATKKNWTQDMTQKLCVTIDKLQVDIKQQVHQSVWINIFNELDCRKKKKKEKNNNFIKLTDLQKAEVVKKYSEKDKVKTSFMKLAAEYNCSEKEIRKALGRS